MWVFEKIPIDVVEIVITKSKDTSNLLETLETMIEKLKEKHISERIKDKLTIHEIDTRFRCIMYNYAYDNTLYRSYEKPVVIHDTGLCQYMDNRKNGHPLAVDINRRCYGDFYDHVNKNCTKDKLIVIFSKGGYTFIKGSHAYVYENDGSITVYNSNFCIIMTIDRLNKYIN